MTFIVGRIQKTRGPGKAIFFRTNEKIKSKGFYFESYRCSVTDSGSYIFQIEIWTGGGNFFNRCGPPHSELVHELCQMGSPFFWNSTRVRNTIS